MSSDEHLPDLIGLELLSDDGVLAAQNAYAAARKRADAGLAIIAAEIARRSARDLGHAGLAQRLGDRTPERLVQRTLGVTSSEARALVSAGESAADPWLSAVDVADLGVAATAAIRAGLGTPSEHVAEDDLADAAQRLARLARTTPPDDVRAAARAERDALDEAGIAEREQRLRDRRFVRYGFAADGMLWIHALLDPESGAIVRGALDEITAPRRGGPRFVDEGARVATSAAVAAPRVAGATATGSRPVDGGVTGGAAVAVGGAAVAEGAAIERAVIEGAFSDDRTLDQATADALVAVARIARSADRSHLLNTGRPAVTVHVQQRDLRRGTGAAWIEGTHTSVSIETAQRIACADGVQTVVFDDSGQPMALGRSRRTFSRAQRRALAARDGGCLVDGCGAPPAMTEAHHIDEYDLDHGATDVADGVLLCRFHHLWVHNLHLRVRRRTGGGYDLVARDPSRSAPAVTLRSKNPIAGRAA